MGIYKKIYSITFKPFFVLFFLEACKNICLIINNCHIQKLATLVLRNWKEEKEKVGVEGKVGMSGR